MNRNVAWSSQMNTYLKFVELSDCYTLINGKSTLDDVCNYTFWETALTYGIVTNDQTSFVSQSVVLTEILALSFKKPYRTLSNFQYIS